MSHVIENEFQSLGVTNDLRLELADKLGEEDCSLSEAAAYFILGSDIFAELVDRACAKTGARLPEAWQEKLCKLILGQPVHPRWPLLQELISGPFDADKLDYMSRDAQSAGIPNLTDIPRLIQKVRVAELPQEGLPAEIAKRIVGGEPSYFVQGILLSGGRTLDELMIARTLLFDKIYRHQKTRAVEAMVSNVVGLLVPLLRPESVLRLKMADVGGIVKAIVAKLRPFQPSVDAGGADGGIDDQKVLTWLRQFGGDEVDSALRMLQALKVLTRGDVRAAVEAFLAANQDFKGCHVCQLGGPRDSSAILTYFAQDLAEKWQLNVTTLQQALAEDNRPILFVDDFLGTGRQAVSIVKHWLDEPYEEQLEEDHGPKLTPKLADEFKRRQLGFAFVYGTNEGRDRLRKELGRSSIQPSIHVHQDEAEFPRAFTGNAVAYASADAASHFQVRCEEIGRQLLQSKQVAAEKIAERTLGYGNNAYLVVFPCNVPTATLTLLWSEGKVDGIDWMPLLPRRKKK